MKKLKIFSAVVLLIVAVAGIVYIPGSFAGASPDNPDGATKLVIVQFKDVESATAESVKETATQRANIANVQNEVTSQLGRAVGYTKLVHKYQNLPMAVYEIDGVGEKSLRANPSVLSVAENKAFAPMAVLTSPITAIGGTPADGFSDSVASQAYNGDGYSVAVLDSGVDKTHPYLSGKVIAEACFSFNATNSDTGGMGTVTSLCGGSASYPSMDTSTASGSAADCDLTIEGCGHGTGVAGIASMNKANPTDASLQGNTITLRGVAADSKIVAMKVFSKMEGSGFCGVGQPSPCIRTLSASWLLAIDRILSETYDAPVAAVNMSLGGGAYASSDECGVTDGDIQAAQVFHALKEKNIAVIVSGGNSGDPADFAANANKIANPACIDGAIAVAASNISGSAMASYTQNGPLTDLIAPGGDITWDSSTVINDPDKCLTWYGSSFSSCPQLNLNSPYISTNPGGGIQYMQGTSMAAPVVSGAFTVLRQKHPEATVDQLLALLQTTGTPINDTRTGYTFDDAGVTAQKRLINLGAALSAKQKPLISNFVGPSSGKINEGSQITVTADVAGAATCVLNHGIGNVAVSSSKISAAVTAYESYELTCANDYKDTDTKTLILANFNHKPVQPGSPDISNIDKDKGSFTITWKASTDPDGDAIASYDVYLDGQKVDTVQGDVLSYVFEDVDLSKDHTVTISATDEFGAQSIVASFPVQKIDQLAENDDKFQKQGGSNQAGGSAVPGAPATGLVAVALNNPLVVLSVGLALALIVSALTRPRKPARR